MMSSDEGAPAWGGSSSAGMPSFGAAPLYASSRGAAVLDVGTPPQEDLARGYGGNGGAGYGAGNSGNAAASGWSSWTRLQKGCAVGWMLFFWILVFAILGLSAQTRNIIGGLHNTNVQATAAAKAATSILQGPLPPPLAHMTSWSQLVAAAAGTTVLFAAESDPGLDDYIDNVLAPYMHTTYGITVNRTVVEHHCDALDMVWTANATGAPGQVDISWINGDLFANLSTGGLLYGPFATSLPSAKFYNWALPISLSDFGTPTLGMEMPYNAAQIVLIYNPQLVSAPPTTMAGLLQWISANSGKFAWPVPTEANDYTAAALLRMAFGVFCPYSQYAASAAAAAPLLNGTGYAQCSAALWDRLASLSPSLYGYDTTLRQVFPPASMSDVDDLFANGSVAWTWSYDPYHAAYMVGSGAWQAGLVASTLLDGTPANFNFVGVPRSAPNLLGALVLANELAAPAQVYARAKPEGSAELPAASASLLPLYWQDLLADLSSVKSALSPSLAQLTSAALAELPLNVQTRLEADWVTHVAHGLVRWHNVPAAPAESCYNPAS